MLEQPETGLRVPIVCALPYDGPVSPTEQKKDKKLGFYHVRPASCPVPEFFFAHSIIRGAVALPVKEDGEDFFIFDILDSNMFLRVQDLLLKV